MKKLKNNKKGASLLLALLIISAVLSIAFGISELSLGEIKISRDAPKSLIAYYAADAGIECQMFADRLSKPNCSSACIDVNSKICYKITISGVSPKRTIKSSGIYQDIIRAIELTY
ncbi:hypothetical protein KKF60_00625 [Patescibacteria group bacterium]|nr:hypothetical protein [Patescibacteria group bacterium]MBU4458403.1 hypothetical protein [Patescibacteria group bacterium]MCG2695842.1 hypothetical protein [Candidatus Portnoybacteria bacterium]